LLTYADADLVGSEPNVFHFQFNRGMVFLQVYEQCKLKFSSLNEDAEPVKVDVYFESFCPDSQRFITQQLAPTYKLMPTNILEPTLVSYGKATVSNFTRPEMQNILLR